MTTPVETDNTPKANPAMEWTAGECRFVWYERFGNGVTYFPDGLQLVAAPNDDEASRKTARKLGYGDTPGELARMCREHELLHTWLARRNGLPASPTLHSVARVNAGLAPLCSTETQCEEEAEVLDLQKALNKSVGDGRTIAARVFLAGGEALCQ